MMPILMIGLWPHVCKAEDQYIKTFKNRANLVLDTSVQLRGDLGILY